MLESPDYFFRVREIGRLRQTTCSTRKCACVSEFQRTKREHAISQERYEDIPDRFFAGRRAGRAGNANSHVNARDRVQPLWYTGPLNRLTSFLLIIIITK